MASKDSGVISPPSSAASDDFMSGLPSDETDGEGEGFGSMIVAGSSGRANASVLSLDPSPASLRSSFNELVDVHHGGNIRRTSSSYDRKYENYDEVDKKPYRNRSGDELVRRLTRALEVTSYELRKTEVELREALVEIARLKELCADLSAPIARPKPIMNLKTRRSGSCPTTSKPFSLPLPTAALFSVIHRVNRQDSY